MITLESLQAQIDELRSVLTTITKGVTDGPRPPKEVSLCDDIRLVEVIRKYGRTDPKKITQYLERRAR